MMVWEPPGDIHTLMSGEEGTVTLFQLEGALLYVDEEDKVVGFDDVLNHTKTYHDFCRAAGDRATRPRLLRRDAAMLGDELCRARPLLRTRRRGAPTTRRSSTSTPRSPARAAAMARAWSLAASLRELGLRPGDRIALMLQNVPAIVIAIHAVWRSAASSPRSTR